MVLAIAGMIPIDLLARERVVVFEERTSDNGNNISVDFPGICEYFILNYYYIFYVNS